MPTINLIEPFDTDNMIYDTVTEQYKLTPQGFDNLTGKDGSIWAGSQVQLDIYLDEMSDNIYNFILENSTPFGYIVKKEMIDHYDIIRPIIEKAFQRQALYDVRSFAFLIQDQHGVNIEKGIAIEKQQLRNNIHIANSVRIGLNVYGLLYRGHLHLPTVLRDA